MEKQRREEAGQHFGAKDNTHVGTVELLGRTWHWPGAVEVCSIHESEMPDPGATNTVLLVLRESSGNPLLPQMAPCLYPLSYAPAPHSISA